MNMKDTCFSKKISKNIYADRLLGILCFSIGEKTDTPVVTMLRKRPLVYGLMQMKFVDKGTITVFIWAK